MCVLDTLVSLAKMAELIEVLFGKMWTLVSLRNHVFDWGLDSGPGKGQFLGGSDEA